MKIRMDYTKTQSHFAITGFKFLKTQLKSLIVYHPNYFLNTQKQNKI